MRSRIGYIAKRAGLNLNESGDDIVLKWKEWVGTPTIDPVTQSKIGTSIDQTETVKGFVHYVKATSAVRQMAEVQEGDCILDLHQDLDLSSRDGLVFVIDGVEWVQKKIGDKLANYWNASMAGQKILQTLLLRQST